MQKKLKKRQQQALDTKKAIFESAITLFKEKGFENVTIEDIAIKAGTAKGSFYTYFKTKSDIIIEEFKDIDQYYENYQTYLKGLSDPLKKLKYFSRAQLRYVRDKVGVDMLKILYANHIMETASTKILIDPNRFLHLLVKEIILEGQEEGSFRSDKTADELAYLFNRGMRAVFLDWAIASASWDLVKVGTDFFETILIPALQFKTNTRSMGDGKHTL